MVIKDLRLKLGITQQELADMFEIPKRSIENWETGQRTCPEYLEKLISEKMNDLIEQKEKYSGKKAIIFDKGDRQTELVKKRISECIEYCISKGLEYSICNEYNELKSCIENKNINFLICTRLDSITRNAKDFTKLFDELVVNNISLISIRDNIDTSIANGKIYLEFILKMSDLFVNIEKEFEKENDKMIIYRPQRRELSESLKEAQEFIDEDEMKNYILNDWNNNGFGKLFDLNDIVISDEMSNDERIGWNKVRMVGIKRCGNELYNTPQCIGYCSYEYE